MNLLAFPLIRLAAVFATGAGLVLAPLPARAGSELEGRWTGIAEQSDGQTYPAIMEFDSDGRGSSDYPSLNCAGKLSGEGRKGAYRFRETIAGSSGRAGDAGRCLDGTIDISVSGNVMRWSWSGEWQGKRITASGTFTRAD